VYPASLLAGVTGEAASKLAGYTKRRIGLIGHKFRFVGIAAGELR
jgi:hypothetical protein